MAISKKYNSYHFSEYFKTEIPSHWQEKQLGYLAKQDRNAFVDGPFGSDLKTTDYQDSGVPLIQLNNIRDGQHILKNIKFVTEIKKRQLVRHVAYPKDLVIAKMAEPVARAAVVNDIYPEYVIVADCVKMTPETAIINTTFLVWAINSDYVRINAELVSTGTTRIRINLGELKKLKIPYPLLSEQASISAFLDHETAKIDNLIEKQQQLIELLKEKRQAVISHAVTKGLTSDVPMKDSGVEWLGEVPEHWNVIKLKYLINIFEQGWSPQCEARLAEKNEYGVLKVGCVNSGCFQPLEHKALPSNLEPQKQYLVKKNDLLISRANTKELVGSSSVVDKDYDNLILCDKLYRLRFNKSANPHLISEFIRTPTVRKQIELSASGASHSMQNIGQDTIKELFVALPPDSEAQQLIVFIRDKISTFDSSIDLSHRQIVFLQERRTALISAAVTGKIDVRDWVAPDTHDIEEPQEATA